MTTRQAKQTVTVTDTTPEAQPIRVEQVDPTTLVVEDNIRHDTNLSRAFLGSIRRHGVLVPILAHPAADGQITVRDGQRRTLAACEVGLGSIPAYIVDAADETTVRIVQQLITNDHREALTDADRAEAWHQLALEGMSVTAIARATGTKKATVEAGITVAGHEVAAQAVTRGDLTLDQALVLIDFEDDPATLKELRRVAQADPDRFDHYAQRCRDERAVREQVAAITVEYEAKGIPVIEWPDWGDTDTLFFADLTTAEGEPLSEDNYTGHPGHAVCLRESWKGVEVGNVVTDWKAHGLRKKSATGRPTGKMTEEEKAERRALIANNKAWGSAEKVRRAWLTSFLARKRLPADALAFAATTFATATFEVGKAVGDRHDLAASLLGYEHPAYGTSPLAALVADCPAKATHVTVAMALGALEAATSKSTWRYPSRTAIAYFQALDAWGYGLSEVEQIVLDAATPDASTEGDEQVADDEADAA